MDGKHGLGRAAETLVVFQEMWAVTSSVFRKLGLATSLLFFKLDIYYYSGVHSSPEATGEGKRAKVELDFCLFARVFPVPKDDHRSS